MGSGRLTDLHTDTQNAYDELGRIITVTTTKQFGQTLASADDTNYYYDLVGNLDHIVYDSDVVADYTYDTLHRLDLLTHYAPENGGGDPNDFTDNEIIASYDYALNADGSRASVSETGDGGQAGTADDLVTTITWTYDNINRLVEEAYSGFDAAGAALEYTTTYTFDLTSNRLTMAKDTGSDGSVEETTTYTYDANDPLLTETFDSTTNAEDRHTVYAYGPTDQTAKTTHEGLDGTGLVREQTSFTYNARGRMASTTIDRFDGTGTLTSSTQTVYIYNDSGIRTQQIVRTDADGDGTYEDVKTHDYLIDPANPTGYAQQLAEIVNTVLDKTYILGRDVIAQAVDNAGTPDIRTLLYDGHGSTRAILDGLAVVLEIYAYDAYGNSLGFDPTAALTALLYSGEFTDAATGMQYLRARYYEPSSGRFNRVDPFTGNPIQPISLHRYLYTYNDPINLIDPSGMQTSTTEQAVVTGVQATILLIVGAAYLARSLQHTTQQTVILQRLAARLGTQVIQEPQVEDGFRMFLHGTSANKWGSSTAIDASIGKVGDFGIGFYTFPAEDYRSLPKAFKRSRTKLALGDRTDIPFVLVVKMSTNDWKSLNKWDISSVSGFEYNQIVNGFRFGPTKPITGYDVIIGNVAVFNGALWQKAPGSAGFPLQYKFEAGGVTRLRFAGIIPTPPEEVQE